MSDDCFQAILETGLACLIQIALELLLECDGLPSLCHSGPPGKVTCNKATAGRRTPKFQQTRRPNFSMTNLGRSVLLLLGISALVLPLSIDITHSQTASPDYKNAKLGVDARVADLLKRMTIEEKVAQLTCLWAQRPQVNPQTDFANDRGELSPEKAQQVMKYGVGQIARQRERKGPREGAAFANSVQKWLIENTRLGIPAMFHDEILHGHMAQGSTSFPQPISLANSWDLDL